MLCNINSPARSVNHGPRILVKLQHSGHLLTNLLRSRLGLESLHFEAFEDLLGDRDFGFCEAILGPFSDTSGRIPIPGCLFAEQIVESLRPRE